MVVFEKKYKWSAARDQDNSLGDEVSQRTLKCLGVSEKAEKKILYELFLNAGPLEKVTIPRDRVTGQQLSVAYIQFSHPESVKYAFSLLNGTVLYGQQLRLQHRASGLWTGVTRQRQPGARGGGGHFRSVSHPVHLQSHQPPPLPPTHLPPPPLAYPHPPPPTPLPPPPAQGQGQRPSGATREVDRSMAVCWSTREERRDRDRREGRRKRRSRSRGRRSRSRSREWRRTRSRSREWRRSRSRSRQWRRRRSRSSSRESRHRLRSRERRRGSSSRESSRRSRSRESSRRSRSRDSSRRSRSRERRRRSRSRESSRHSRSRERRERRRIRSPRGRQRSGS